MHGGTVSVASRGVGHGALFAVQLPTQSLKFTPIPPSAAPPASEPKLPAVDTLSGVSVLVVDDQPDARDLMVAILLQHGAEVHGAASVEEAIGLLGRERVQVLVSDIGMPHQDGHALIHQVRETDALRQLPAIALTAYAHEHDRQRALAAGYHLHLAKPVEPAHFVLAIAGLLRDQAAASND
jgi:CheY-like chemotaxis protein